MCPRITHVDVPLPLNNYMHNFNTPQIMSSISCYCLWYALTCFSIETRLLVDLINYQLKSILKVGEKPRNLLIYDIYALHFHLKWML